MYLYYVFVFIYLFIFMLLCACVLNFYCYCYYYYCTVCLFSFFAKLEIRSFYYFVLFYFFSILLIHWFIYSSFLLQMFFCPAFILKICLKCACLSVFTFTFFYRLHLCNELFVLKLLGRKGSCCLRIETNWKDS